ncbi:MAG: SpoIIE family protein phosphatase [Proteobacteria bacterium]|nr:SpoIIE family protein phosphatase [Pseudomonadota bacterium]
MPTKIMVVDDEPDTRELIRVRFRRQAREDQWIFVFANDGKHALSLLKEDRDIDIVLLDINMPVMDGFEFLKQARAQDDLLFRTIIISAHDDMANIRRAMNLGAFDFAIKPFNFQDLDITIRKALEDLRAHKEALDVRNQLELAADIQSAILLNTFPENKKVEFHAKMIPAKKVGGDLYDFLTIDKNRIGVLIGDVSGKGPPAAIAMASSLATFRNIAPTASHPDTCLEVVNDVLIKSFPENRFITIFYGVLDLRDGSFEYCRGGHNPPYHISASGVVTRLDNEGGRPLGMFEGTEYPSGRMTLGKGDTIFAYTDGVNEALDTADQEFGEERLKRLLQQNPNVRASVLVGKVIEQVGEFASGVSQRDDITCLALRYLGTSVREER